MTALIGQHVYIIAATDEDAEHHAGYAEAAGAASVHERAGVAALALADAVLVGDEPIDGWDSGRRLIL